MNKIDVKSQCHLTVLANIIGSGVSRDQTSNLKSVSNNAIFYLSTTAEGEVFRTQCKSD